ncbi:MAG: hypothetical protein ACXWVO_11915 [Caulobacteraceae bacterium]
MRKRIFFSFLALSAHLYGCASDRHTGAACTASYADPDTRAAVISALRNKYGDRYQALDLENAATHKDNNKSVSFSFIHKEVMLMDAPVVVVRLNPCDRQVIEVYEFGPNVPDK